MKDFSITASYTDLYQLSMGQVFFLSGNARKEASFDYFFRKIPVEGGYVVFAGLASVLEILQDLTFTPDDISYLESLGFREDYLKFLKDFRFRGDVWSVREGEIVFPNEPLLRVEGSMFEAQVIETMLLNLVNFQSLIATRAARIRSVAGDRHLSEFGLRRAQGAGGYHATRAAAIGGFDSTSNVKAARDFGLPAAGTMAHSFIQSYASELDAFRDFADKRPQQCTLLVDTYDTLQSGLPNAIAVGKELERKGHRLQGVRLDSGDLAYLSKQARKMLDDSGLNYVKITASNQLDEFVIKSLVEQKAPIDVFGVGTSLVTAPPDAALDGVYKLAFADGKPRIKLSENIKKLTLPDKKQVYRVLGNEGQFYGADVVTLHDEKVIRTMHHPYDAEKHLSLEGMNLEPLISPVMKNGKIVSPQHSLQEISAYRADRLSKLPEEHRRFEYPHIYKVGLSERLLNLRNDLRNQYKRK